MRLKSITVPDAAKYDEQKGEVRERLEWSRQSEVLEDHKDQLMSSATILIASP